MTDDMDDSSETLSELAEHILPFGRRVRLLNIDYHNGLNMMRLIWREGKRITQVDIDADSAAQLGADLVAWAKQNTPDNES